MLDNWSYNFQIVYNFKHLKCTAQVFSILQQPRFILEYEKKNCILLTCQFTFMLAAPDVSLDSIFLPLDVFACSCFIQHTGSPKKLRYLCNKSQFQPSLHFTCVIKAILGLDKLVWKSYEFCSLVFCVIFSWFICMHRMIAEPNIGLFELKKKLDETFVELNCKLQTIPKNIYIT